MVIGVITKKIQVLYMIGSNMNLFMKVSENKKLTSKTADVSNKGQFYKCLVATSISNKI